MCRRSYHLRTAAAGRHPLPPGRYGGEPIFVAVRGASRQDDGYLLTLVLDAYRGRRPARFRPEAGPAALAAPAMLANLKIHRLEVKAC